MKSDREIGETAALYIPYRINGRNRLFVGANNSETVSQSRKHRLTLLPRTRSPVDLLAARRRRQRRRRRRRRRHRHRQHRGSSIIETERDPIPDTGSLSILERHTPCDICDVTRRIASHALSFFFIIIHVLFARV